MHGFEDYEWPLFEGFEGDLIEAESKIPLILKELCNGCCKFIETRQDPDDLIKKGLAEGKIVPGENFCTDCLFLKALS